MKWNKLLTAGVFALGLSQAYAFEFDSCTSKSSGTENEIQLQEKSNLTRSQVEFCRRKLSEFNPSLISDFLGSDLKSAFGCHMAFEMEKNIQQLQSLRECLEESKRNDPSCRRMRAQLDTETLTAYNESLVWLMRAKPYIDRDRIGASAFRLESEFTSEIGMVQISRTAQQRVSSLITNRVTVKAGLSSLDFEGVNIDSILQSIGLDIGILGGYQSIPALPAPLVESERNEFVSFVSDILVACDRGRDVEANSMQELTAAFMHKAELCETELVQPLLQVRQGQALSKYLELVARHPQIAYMDVRSLPLRLNSRDEVSSRRMLRDAFRRVDENIRKFQKILLSNQVDYDTESALLMAMDQFLSLGDHTKYCSQARQILRLRPLAHFGQKAKRFFVNQLAYSSCYASSAFLGTPVTGSVVCPVVIESSKVALEAGRSLRLSQSLTLFSDDDRLIEGIVTSRVLVNADRRFVEAYGRLSNLPRDLILRQITRPLEDLIAEDLVKRGFVSIPRKADGSPDLEGAKKKARRLIRGLRRIAEI